MPSAIAIFVSDIHLSHTPPAARSNEPDWYAAMGRTFAMLAKIQKRYGTPPIFCAGDVFDRYNPPPELINFAIEQMPCMYAVPGQHDLPNHRYSDIERSAYWTLVEAGILTDLGSGAVLRFENFTLFPYPWDFDPEETPLPRSKKPAIALIHKFMWYGDPEHELHSRTTLVNQCFQKWGKKFKLVVSGDNHQSFRYTPQNESKVRMLNCGSFMRRSIDQSAHRPVAWVLLDDWTVTYEDLGHPGDVMLSREETQKIEQQEIPGLSKVIEELKSLGLEDDQIKFEAVVDAVVRKVNPKQIVRKVIRSIMEASQSE